MTKRIVITVISDLVTDQRVAKVAQTLHENGYTVMLTGAKRRSSLPLAQRPYKTKRLRLLFQKGFLMYAEWNFRLFWWLLFQKAHVLLANDLDTLLPNYLVAKLRRKKLVYDTHEFFTGLEELQNRPFVKKVWTRLENFLFPRVKHIYTVNETLAQEYEKKFGKQPAWFRNLPYLKQPDEALTPVSLPFKNHQRILLMQGAGIHFNRGAEELLEALRFLPGQYVLVFAGNGLAMETLRQMAATPEIRNRVYFAGLLTPAQLRTVTRQAWLGFSLDKNTSVNYYCSLPNKLFDYLAAGVPVIAGKLPEVAKIVQGYDVGLITEITPQAIAHAILQTDAEERQRLHENTQTAMQTLNWERESERLIAFYNSVMR